MVLVTGGAGFIGSHLVHNLVARGERVRVLDNFSTGSWENLAPVADVIEIVEGDIVDQRAVSSAMQDVTRVLHLAAIASVDASVRDPLHVHRVNVDGTLNILLAARDARVQRLVFASSAAVYGDTEHLPLHEDLPMRALSPYAASKAAGETYIHAFAAAFGVKATILRYFNVFGPRQDPTSPYSGVISKFVTALQRGESPTIFGDGHQTRDFVYVGDVVRANLLACSSPSAIGRTCNIAGGRQLTILRLCEALNDALDCTLAPQFAAPRLGDVRHSLADITRAQQVLGWQPITDLANGLRQTVDWLNASTQS